jgi:oligoendopeptidase F
MKKKAVALVVAMCSLLLYRGIAMDEKTKYPTEWDLSCFYDAPSSDRVKKDINNAEKAIEKFIDKYKERLTISVLPSAVAEYDDIYRTSTKIFIFAQLNYQTKLNSTEASAFYQKIKEWLAINFSKLCWFLVEMQKLNYEAIQKKLKEDPEFMEYSAFIDSVFKYRKHTLSTAEETIMSRIEPATGDAWYKFHEELLSGIDFFIKKKRYNLSEILNLANYGKTENERKNASIALSNGLAKNSQALVAIFNNIVLTEQICRDIRKYDAPEESTYLRDNVSKEIIDTMLKAVDEKVSTICHRYYKIKAKLLEKDKISYWDRGVPVKFSRKANKKFSYDEAIKIVLAVFKGFFRTFYEQTMDIVNNGWVDVYPKDGKATGAFSSAATVDTHPFVLLNFHGDIRDVLTIAHEFGHAIHQKLSAKNKQLVCDPPLNISETASIFAEKLTNRYLLARESDQKKKIELICARLDDVMSTIFRQAAFFKFEQKIHRMRSEKELTHTELSKTWRNELEKSLGTSVDIHPCIDEFWGYVTHFTSCPFYVYSYIFGSLFVEGLYAIYERDEEKFIKVYEKMLTYGGTKTPEELAEMYNINLKDKKFWQSALKVIEDEVNDLEKLCDLALRNHKSR